jgi:hypothetical protein
LNEGVIEDLSFTVDDFGNIVPMNECEGACDLFEKEDINNAFMTKFAKVLEELKNK